MKKEKIPIQYQPICKKCGCRVNHERVAIGKWILSFGKCGGTREVIRKSVAGIDGLGDRCGNVFIFIAKKQ